MAEKQGVHEILRQLNEQRARLQGYAKSSETDAERMYYDGCGNGIQTAKNIILDVLLKPKENMAIYEAVEILNKKNGCIRRKCWNERWYLTETYDPRLDCILLVDSSADTLRPYQFKMIDLLADDWEECECS